MCAAERENEWKKSDAAFLRCGLVNAKENTITLWGLDVYTFHSASGIRYHCLISLFAFLRPHRSLHVFA